MVFFGQETAGSGFEGMTPKQMIEFDARREAVLRAHLARNPKYRKMMRDRRVAFAAGVVRYFAGLGLVLFLIKAFLMGQYGQDGYLALVAPLMAHVPADGLLAQSIAPDHYSGLVASAMAELFAPTAQTATSPSDGLERIIPGLSES
ncbi:hypothetical protein Ga0058931_0432 [Roseibaca calidilacus]|uniref:Uncharacterized protein n=2 Tax=Roseibaca calidilacus TaxID=1666912 RepID=A0ABM9VPS1_9RHOB|nr:hypothetical protein Ga0058931_0432 [Roseibaca calidilacus]